MKNDKKELKEEKTIDMNAWYQLLDQGWNSDLEKAVDDLNGEDRLEGELWRTLWLGYYHGQFQKAEMNVQMFLTQPNLSKRIEIVGRLVLADLAKMKLYDKIHETELEKIEALYNELSPSQQKEYLHYKVWLLYIKSIYASFRGDHSNSLLMISEAIKYTRKEGFAIQYFEPLCLFMKGDFQAFLGEFNASMSLYKKSIELYQQLGNEPMMIWAMISLSDVYRFLGEMDKSLELCIQVAAIAEKLKYNEQQISSLMTIGFLYWLKGKFKNAQSSFEKAMTYVQEKNLKFVNLYQNYIELLIEMGKNEQVNKHLIEYYKLCDELRAPQHFSQRMKAIHLKKTGVDFEAKAQAQKLFRDLLKQAEKDFSFHQKLTIIFHLIDLLLEEAKIFDNSSKMQEIIVLINQGTEMSQDNPRALIQIYLLQAKILLIEGKIDDSLSLLEKAHTLAMNKYLKPLAQEAKVLQEQLQSEYTKWKGIIESNTSLNERIAFSEVKGYIDDAIRIRDLGNKSPSKISQNDL